MPTDQMTTRRKHKIFEKAPNPIIPADNKIKNYQQLNTEKLENLSNINVLSSNLSFSPNI